jgi:5-hydroxyisourate hydrolase
MARISTHVLDIATGVPAAGVKVELYFDDALVISAITNADGRTDVPLLVGEEIPVGKYELVFQAGDYFRTHGATSEFLFLDEIVIRFGVNDSGGNYHVPLLVAPNGYSTYRGS